jgi:hypothetical protein
MPPPHRFRARLAKSTILNTKVTGHWHVPRGYRCTQLALAAGGAGFPRPKRCPRRMPHAVLRRA